MLSDPSLPVASFIQCYYLIKAVIKGLGDVTSERIDMIRISDGEDYERLIDLMAKRRLNGDHRDGLEPLDVCGPFPASCQKSARTTVTLRQGLSIQT